MAIEVVVDSSVIVALVTLEKYSEWASKSIQEYEYFHVLDLSFYEVANAIEHKVSDEFGAKDAAAAFEQAEKMMKLYAVHNFSEVIVDALNKALELKIAVYDAAFLSLACKLDLRFLTFDTKLAKKLECTKYEGLIECPNKTPHI
jgi:predicted nucleic acid-binding protein